MVADSNWTTIGLIPNIPNLNKSSGLKILVRRKDLSALGAKAKRELGEKTSEFILDILRKNPSGVTVYELANELGRKGILPPGTAHSALNRLAEAGKVDVREMTHDGRLSKVVYPKDAKKKERPVGFFMLNKTELPKWKSSISGLYVYGINRDTIIVAPEKRADLENKPYPSSNIIAQQTNSTLSFRLPKELIDFYELYNNDVEIDIVGKSITIRVILQNTEQPSDLENIKSILKHETFLIVDDEPDVLASIRYELERQYYDLLTVLREQEIKAMVERNIFSASSYDEAKLIIETKRPSVLILDWIFHEKPLANDILCLARKNGVKVSIVITAKPHDRTNIKSFIEHGAIWCYDKETKRLAEKMLSRASRSIAT